MQWTIISAVNNEQVLETNLLDSPGIESAAAVILQRGYPSAAAAYNDAIQKAKTDLLVFVHQDVYLPAGWFNEVEKTLQALSEKDPNWGVVGIWGAVSDRDPVGCLCWTGDLGWEEPFEGAKEVISLDEVVLVFRKSSGLVFDENLPGYHLYGTDICMEARRNGRKCYAISALCIHNTNTETMLPLQFWKCYLFMRRKWRDSLPIKTPCTRITFLCWPIIRWHLVAARDIALGRRKRLERVASPRKVYEALLARDVAPAAKVKARASAAAAGKHQAAANLLSPSRES